MRNVIEILNKIRSTSSTNFKIDILKACREGYEGDILKKILYYTYNPYLKYGVTEKAIEPIQGISKYNDIFELLDMLAKSNINNNLRKEINMFLGALEDENLLYLYKGILLKDLRLNMSTKTINKVFDGLIPTCNTQKDEFKFNVMLAKSFFKEKEGFLNGREFILTTKLDGCRMFAVNNADGIKLYSRQGQVMEGFLEIEEDISKLPFGIYDGEVLLRNDDNLPSDDLYRATMRVIRKDGVKYNVEFHIFDYVDFDNFDGERCKVPFKTRKQLLTSILNSCSLPTLKEVPVLYQGNDEEKILSLLSIAKDNNEEGLMLNIANGFYECKRSKTIFKVKVFQEADLRVLDIIEGTKKNKGKLGSITVQFEHNGVLYISDCGSGFKDYERELYWKNPELILGKIVTIRFFEISKNKDGGVALRFPTFTSRIREDKTEISMN